MKYESKKHDIHYPINKTLISNCLLVALWFKLKYGCKIYQTQTFTLSGYWPHYIFEDPITKRCYHYFAKYDFGYSRLLFIGQIDVFLKRTHLNRLIKKGKAKEHMCYKEVFTGLKGGWFKSRLRGE